MAIPECVTIGTATWTISMPEVLSDNGQRLEGQCDSTSQSLRILSDLPQERQEHVFLHELLHAVCDYVGIDEEETLTPEQFITRLSPALHTVLKENGAWF